MMPVVFNRELKQVSRLDHSYASSPTWVAEEEVFATPAVFEEGGADF